MIDYTNGINTIWKEDYDYQYHALSAILETIRGLTGIAKDNLLNVMITDGMFYVPSDRYMIDVFGDQILDYKNGIYTNYEECKLCYRLAMPMRLFDNSIVGFIGYSNKNDFNEGDESFIKYLYPPKFIIKKGRYVYCTRDEFLKAVNDEYICIVDGLFDQKALVANGINALSLCGSSLTRYHRVYLNSIKHKIVIADNDEAGRQLYALIKNAYPDTVEIKQNKTKDIDSFMHTTEAINELKSLIKLMKSEGFIISHSLKSRKLEVLNNEEV